MSHLGGRDSRMSLPASQATRSSSGSNALNRPRIGSSAPVFNPFDKFTEDEFTDWIGGIKGTLKGALGLQDEQSKAVKVSAEAESHSFSAMEEESEIEDYSEEDTEDPVAKTQKGKERDPMEGPGLVLTGAGTFDSPIDLGIDSDSEDEAQDEEEFEASSELDEALPEGAGSWIRADEQEQEQGRYTDEEVSDDQGYDGEEECYSEDDREPPSKDTKPEVIELLSSSEDEEEEDQTTAQQPYTPPWTNRQYSSEEEQDELDRGDENAVYGHLTDDEGSGQDTDDDEVSSVDAEQPPQDNSAFPMQVNLTQPPSSIPPPVELVNSWAHYESFAEDLYTGGPIVQEKDAVPNLDYLGFEVDSGERVQPQQSSPDNIVAGTMEMNGYHEPNTGQISIDGWEMHEITASKLEEFEADHLLQYPGLEDNQRSQPQHEISGVLSESTNHGELPSNQTIPDRTPSPAIDLEPRLVGLFDFPATSNGLSKELYSHREDYDEGAGETHVQQITETPPQSKQLSEAELITILDSEDEDSGSEVLDDSERDASGSEDAEVLKERQPPTLHEEDDDVDASGESDEEHSIARHESGFVRELSDRAVKQEILDQELQHELHQDLPSEVPEARVHEQAIVHDLEKDYTALEADLQHCGLEAKQADSDAGFEQGTSPSATVTQADVLGDEEESDEEMTQELLVKEQSTTRGNEIDAASSPSPSLPLTTAEVKNHITESPEAPSPPRDSPEYICVDEDSDQDASGDDDDEHLQSQASRAQTAGNAGQTEGPGDELLEKSEHEIDEVVEAHKPSNEPGAMTSTPSQSPITEAIATDSVLIDESAISDIPLLEHTSEHVQKSPALSDDEEASDTLVAAASVAEDTAPDGPSETTVSQETSALQGLPSYLDLNSDSDTHAVDSGPGRTQLSPSPQPAVQHMEHGRFIDQDANVIESSPVDSVVQTSHDLPLPSERQQDLEHEAVAVDSQESAAFDSQGSTFASASPVSAALRLEVDEEQSQSPILPNATILPARSTSPMEEEAKDSGKQHTADSDLLDVEELAAEPIDAFKSSTLSAGQVWIPDGDHYVLEQAPEQDSSSVSIDTREDDGHHHVHFLINKDDDGQVVVSPGESSEENSDDTIEIEEIASPPASPSNSQELSKDAIESSKDGEGVNPQTESQDVQPQSSQAKDQDTDSTSSPNDDIFGDEDDGDQDTAPSPPMEELVNHSPFQVEQPLILDTLHQTLQPSFELDFFGKDSVTETGREAVDALDEDDNVDFEHFMREYIQQDDDEDEEPNAFKLPRSPPSAVPTLHDTIQAMLTRGHAVDDRDSAPNEPSSTSGSNVLSTETTTQPSIAMSHEGSVSQTRSAPSSNDNDETPEQDAVAMQSGEVSPGENGAFHSPKDTPIVLQDEEDVDEPKGSVSDSMESLFGGEKSSEDEGSEADHTETARAFPLQHKVSPSKPSATVIKRRVTTHRSKRTAGTSSSASAAPSPPTLVRASTTKRKALEESPVPRKKSRNESDNVRQTSIASTSSAKSVQKQGDGSDRRPSPVAPDDGSFIVISRSNNTPQREKSIPVAKSAKGKGKAVAVPDEQRPKRPSKQESLSQKSASLFSLPLSLPSFPSFKFTLPSDLLFHKHGAKQLPPPPPKQMSPKKTQSLRIPARSNSLSESGNPLVTPVAPSKSMPRIQAASQSVGPRREHNNNTQEAGPSKQHSHTGDQHLPSRSTRSNCRFHKISIPKDEGAPRAIFLVPGCSLTNFEFMKEEEIEDLGDATMEDASHMVQDVETLDFLPYLKKTMRMLVGPNNWREKQLYYLPGPNDPPIKRVKRPSRRSLHWEWADAGLSNSGSSSTVSVGTPTSKLAQVSQKASTMNGKPKRSGSISGTPLASAMLRRNAARRQSVAKTSEEDNDEDDDHDESESSDSDQYTPDSRSRPKLKTQQSNRPLDGVSPDHQALLTQPLRGEKGEKRRKRLHDDDYVPASSDGDATDTPPQADGSQRRKSRTNKGAKRRRPSDAGLSHRSPKKLKLSATSPT